MHELALARALWDAARREAGGAPLVGIQVALGSLSHIDPATLAASFALLSPCRLVIRPEQALSRCSSCGHAEEVGFPWSPRCSRCGGEVSVTGGRDLRLESLEVEEPEPRSAD